VRPERVSVNSNVRCFGTNASRTMMFLLPVPERPQTNQLSSISTSPTGSKKNAPS
jgi:hypothetical protein